jgi:hypothetical protein
MSNEIKSNNEAHKETQTIINISKTSTNKNIKLNETYESSRQLQDKQNNNSNI